MSLANTKASSAYQDALSATKAAWDEVSSGFVEKSENPNLASAARQLNSVIYLLVRLDTKLTTLEERLSQVERRITSLGASRPVDLKEDLDKLTAKLEGLKISGPGEVQKEKGGKLKVFRNPYEILKSIQ